MNYLAIANAVKEKCGVSGSALTTVTGQSGEALRIVNWVNDAYMDIQGMYENWNFMRSDFSFSTVSHQQSYTPTQCGITDFANWDCDSFRNYQTSIGYGSEFYMSFQPYDDFRNLYQFGAQRTVYQRPVVFSIDPAKNLLLGPNPNATGYTVLGKYFKIPSEMAASADIPVIPTEYHRIIVFRAMMFYGAYESAAEVLALGEKEFSSILARMELNQLPQIELGDPLV